MAEQPWLKDPPIYDSNSCVCSCHFTEQDLVSSVVVRFGPNRATLNPDVVPKVCFLYSAKCRKLSDTQKAKPLHRSVIDVLLKEPSTEPHSSKEQESAIREIGIQCS